MDVNISLQPSIKQMLDIGEDCGLKTVYESFDNYLNNYDCFFLLSDYSNQYKKFIEELENLGLIEIITPTHKKIKDISIENAKKLINNKES